MSDFVQQVELPIPVTIDDELIGKLTKRFMEGFDPTRLQKWNKMLSLTDSLGHSLQRNNGINGITYESLQRINDHIYNAAKANLAEKQTEIEQILGLELIRFYQGNQA